MSGAHEQPGDTSARSSDPRAALALAYDRFAAALYRYALVILLDHGAAEDVVQQAFAKLAARRDGMTGIDSPADYLRTAVRNECWRLLNHRRRQHESVESAIDIPVLEPVDRAAENEEERRRVEAAMTSLPPDQREVVYLKVYENRTFQEIAGWLGVSINTVSSRYRYALEKLRQRLMTHAS